jgi:hypothetical protein
VSGHLCLVLLEAGKFNIEGKGLLATSFIVESGKAREEPIPTALS